MTYPPHQPPGQGGPQGYPQQPQHHSPQGPYGQPPYPSQPQQPYAAQPPHGQQPYPGQPQGQPQPWGQQPQQQWAPQGPVPTPPWKSPIVLGIGGVVLAAVIVIGLVVVTGGDDSETTTAQATTTQAESAAATTTKSSSSTTSATKSTTTSKAAPAQTLSAEGTAVLQALPAALRQSMQQNKVNEKDPTPGGTDTWVKKITGTISAKDALTNGLMHHVNNDHYPIAYIETDSAKLMRIWNSQSPEQKSDEGTRVVRIDDTQPNGSATLEVFIPSSNLYFVMSGFSNKDAAKQFVQRAGF